MQDKLTKAQKIAAYNYEQAKKYELTLANEAEKQRIGMAAYYRNEEYNSKKAMEAEL